MLLDAAVAATGARLQIFLFGKFFLVLRSRLLERAKEPKKQEEKIARSLCECGVPRPGAGLEAGCGEMAGYVSCYWHDARAVYPSFNRWPN